MSQDEEIKLELAELQAENDRLRKALEKITELTDDRFIFSIAREALEEM